MVSADRQHTIRSQDGREDPSQDYRVGPEEKAWDEEDGLFDGEEIVVG